MKKLATDHIVTIVSAKTLSALVVLYVIFENLLLNLAKGVQLSGVVILRLMIAML